jgi:hypothetical protein
MATLRKNIKTRTQNSLCMVLYSNGGQPKHETLVLCYWPRRRVGKRMRSSTPSSIYLVNVKFTLEAAMKAQRGSRGIALLFL